MNTQDTTIQKIRGAIGAKVLSKAPELFNQSISVVLSELLQNSRRAGATRVNITLASAGSRTFVTMKDNGGGIDDLQKLVTFGESGWNMALDIAENAAGMGIFSVASRGATFESKGKHVTLTTAVFTGEAEAAVTTCKYEAGTSIMFELLNDEVKSFNNVLEAASLTYPVDVYLNGAKIVQTNFLEHAVAVQDIDGVTVGAFNNAHLSKRHNLLRSGTFHEDGSDINFFGHRINIGMQTRLYIADGKSDHEWSVKFDVSNAPDIRLVLPTRDKPIENAAWASLQAKAKVFLYETIAKQSSHRIPMKDVLEARSLGVAMPDPKLVLKKWAPERDNHHIMEHETPYVPNKHNFIIDHHGNDEALTALNFIRDAGSATFWDADPHYTGLKAYDDIPRIEDLKATVISNKDEVFDIDLFNVEDSLDMVVALLTDGKREEYFTPRVQSRVKEIRLTMTSNTDPEGAITCCIPFLLLSSEGNPDLYDFLIAEKDDTNVWTICDQISEVVYYWDRFNENDGPEYNSNDFTNDIATEIHALYRTSAQHLIERALAQLADEVWQLGLRNGITKINITSDKGEDNHFTITANIEHEDGTKIDRKIW
jgi:hypothetical protein